MQILLPLVVLFAFFWFFVLLPQRRRQRAHTTMQDSLSVGDEVITAGGLHGDVLRVEDSLVQVEIAPSVVVRVDRRAIAARVEPEEDGTEPEEPAALAEPFAAAEPTEAPAPVDGDRG